MKRYTARYIYSLENKQPIENGFVDIGENGKIIDIGKVENFDNSEYIDGAIVPGFVNTHCHIELSYLLHSFKKGTGMAGFIDQINALRNNKSKQERIEDIRHWMNVLWERGVSAMGDISNCDDSFQIKSESPMYTRTFLEVFGTEPADCESVMEGVRKLWEKAESFGLDAGPTPHSCYTMSPELVTASSKEGLTTGYLSFHSEETEEEEEMLKFGRGAMYVNRKKAGMSTPPVTGTSSLLYFIERLKEIHKPPFNEHILLVHEVCMDKEGMDAVKKNMTNVYIALCPLSNIFIHNALPPLNLMRKEGLKLTIGTDSLSSNDDLNIISELFCLQENFSDISLGEMLIWACRNGAEFLGKQDIMGSLEIGKTPGLVAIENLDKEGRLTTASASRRLV